MFWAYIITLARAALYAYKTREELVQLEAQYANSPEQCILNKFYDEIDPIERRPVQVETEDLEFHYVDHRNVSHRLIQRNFAWFFFLMGPREHFKQRVNNFCGSFITWGPILFLAICGSNLFFCCSLNLISSRTVQELLQKRYYQICSHSKTKVILIYVLHNILNSFTKLFKVY